MCFRMTTPVFAIACMIACTLLLHVPVILFTPFLFSTICQMQCSYNFGYILLTPTLNLNLILWPNRQGKSRSQNGVCKLMINVHITIRKSEEEVKECWGLPLLAHMFFF